MLDRAIANGTLEPPAIDALADVLASFYRNERWWNSTAPEIYRARLRENIEGDHAALMEPAWQLPRARLIALRDAQRDALERHAAAFDARVTQGHVVEGHGDLRPEHVCLVDPPVIIDCLEFNASVRILDAADELAYLALECEHLGAAWIGPLVFDTYASESGDRPPPAIIAFYKTHRAVLRAKLAVWHLRDHPPGHTRVGCSGRVTTSRSRSGTRSRTRRRVR